MFASPGRLLTPTTASRFAPEVQAIINAMVPTPDAARQEVINNLVTALVDAGVWSKMGVLYVFAAHSQQAGLLNWKNPSGLPALALNSPTFTTDVGFTGAGGTAYVDTQIPYNTVPGVSRNDAHAGGLATYTESALTFVGAAGTGNATGLHQAAGGALGYRISTGTGSLSVGTFAFNTCHHQGVVRVASTDHIGYMDGVSVGPGAVVSTEISSNNLAALRTNTTYATSAVTAHALHAGSYLTDVEMAAVSAALRAYAAALGIP